MTAAAYFSGAVLLTGALWSAAQFASKHEGDTLRSSTQTIQQPVSIETDQRPMASDSQILKAPTVEWPFFFGHRAAAQVFAALQFLSSLAKLWNAQNDSSTEALGIEKMQKLLLSNAGFQSYATMAVSFLALEAGDFENAIKLARTQRASSESRSMEYFQTSMVLAFIQHYFSHDFHQAGQIYLELAEQNPKLTWLAMLGNKLTALPKYDPSLLGREVMLPELPLGVRAQICKTLLRQSHGAQGASYVRNFRFLGPCSSVKNPENEKELQERIHNEPASKK